MICELLSHRLYTKLKLNTGQKGFWWFNPATIRLQLYKNFTILGDRKGLLKEYWIPEFQNSEKKNLNPPPPPTFK